MHDYRDMGGALLLVSVNCQSSRCSGDFMEVA